MRRAFLLSPANLSGVRGRLIRSEKAKFELASRLRSEGAPVGEVFSFVSGLYFRGKLAYARAFAETAGNVLVITSCRGLLAENTMVGLDDLRRFCEVEFDPADAKYRGPLDRDLHVLAHRVPPDCQIVLLGSVATPKYVAPLLEVFGERLVFPREFAGRGDMSRGGLMLRCVESRSELEYVPVLTAERHGRRPPKLIPIRKAKAGAQASVQKS